MTTVPEVFQKADGTVLLRMTEDEAVAVAGALGRVSIEARQTPVSTYSVFDALSDFTDEIGRVEDELRAYATVEFGDA